MKICPVCSARCYDDMSVCYGCLHDFSKDEHVKEMPDGYPAALKDKELPFDFSALAAQDSSIEEVEEAVNPRPAPSCAGITFEVPAGYRMVVSLEKA